MSYDEAQDFLEHKENIDSMDWVLRNMEVSSQSRVLDVGGGQGMHACFLASRYRETWCLDIIKYQNLYGGEYYRLFKEKCERNGISYDQDNLQFIEGDAMDMLFRDGYFDFVTSFNAFEHIPEPRKALAEIVRVTKPGALIYLTFDPIWTADTGSHFIHRVPAPWSHLVMTDAEFVDTMREAGADEGEILDYRHGMNRLRLPYYKSVFADVISTQQVEVLHETTWSGFAEHSYREHENYKSCLALGYQEEELAIRGMRFLLRKTK